MAATTKKLGTEAHRLKGVTIPMNGTLIILKRDIMRGGVTKIKGAEIGTINGSNTWKILRIDEAELWTTAGSHS